jgi:polyisoprenoid-binding protein YceI
MTHRPLTLLSLAFALALPAAALAASASGPSEWKIDPAHTTVGFSVPHMVISEVEGRFREFSGDVRIDDDKPKDSKVTFVVKTASVDTDNDKRDDHLRSPDFFDSEKHPKMTFESKKIRKVGKDDYRVTGELTIRGVTRPVTLKVELSKPLKDPWGNTVRGVRVRGEIDRKDFGLTWNKVLEAGGVLVGDEVTIDIKMELKS